MSLEPEVRNEVAYRYILKHFSERPLLAFNDAVSTLRHYLPGISQEEAGEYASDVFNEIFARKFPPHRFRYLLEPPRRHELSWDLLLAIKFDEGIKVGHMNRRQIGNEAKQLNITPRVAWTFAQLVIKEVFERTFNSES